MPGKSLLPKLITTMKGLFEGFLGRSGSTLNGLVQEGMSLILSFSEALQSLWGHCKKDNQAM